MNRHNHCFVIGNLGHEPTQRGKTAKGDPIVGFSIAENVQSPDPDTRQFRTVHTNWFNVTAFGPLAERVLLNLHKGERVAVQGRMKITKFTSRTGEERTGFEILADDVARWDSLGRQEQAPGEQEEAPPRKLAVAPKAEEAGGKKKALPF